MSADNVDRSLIGRFQASRDHERTRRELLPPEWVGSDRSPADHLGDVFDAMVARAHEHVRAQREAVRRAAGRGQSQA